MMLRAGDAFGFRGGFLFPGAGGAAPGRWLDFARTFAGLPGAGWAMTGAGRATTGVAR
ncbi:hypothetical protein [Streptomyces sp. NPDC006335]|uniref:hypothetical protein n=1 Tax=Streptomyces sp. NPDC006335 TaxID=3156895 RepID=UPI0033B27009